MATAMHFSEANAAFSVYRRPTIPLQIRPQGTGQRQTTENVSVWYFTWEELIRVSQTGLVYLRLLGPAPFAQLVRVYFWNASPVAFDGQTIGPGHAAFLDLAVRLEPYSLETGSVDSTLTVWQLSEVGRTTVLMTNYIVLSLIGEPVDCLVSGLEP